MKKMAFLILSTCLVMCAHAERWSIKTVALSTNNTAVVLDGVYATPVLLKSITLFPPPTTTNTTTVTVSTPGQSFDLSVGSPTYTNTAYRITAIDMLVSQGQTIWITNSFSKGTAIIEFQME